MSLFHLNADSEELWMPEIEISSPEPLSKKFMDDLFPDMIECGIRLNPQFVHYPGNVELLSEEGESLGANNLYENQKVIKQLDFDLIPDSIFCENKGVRWRINPDIIKVSLKSASWLYDVIHENGIQVSRQQEFSYGAPFGGSFLSLKQIKLYIAEDDVSRESQVFQTLEERIQSGEMILPAEMIVIDYPPAGLFLENNANELKTLEGRDYISYHCGYFEDDVIWVRFKLKPQ